MRDTSLFDNRFNIVKNVKSFQFVEYDTISKKIHNRFPFQARE